nr:hypothetical protein Iba_chr09bCG5350 [Ipomoea batatas]
MSLLNLIHGKRFLQLKASISLRFMEGLLPFLWVVLIQRLQNHLICLEHRMAQQIGLLEGYQLLHKMKIGMQDCHQMKGALGLLSLHQAA